MSLEATASPLRNGRGREVSLAALAVALVAPACAAAAPRTALVPAAGPAGSAAVVSGAAFARGRHVVVSVAGHRVARVKVGARGRFRAAVTIPAGARGRVSVRSRSGGASVRNVFRVGARALAGEVASAAGLRVLWRVRPGSLLLRGAGFGSHRRVVIRVGQRVRRLRAGRHGRFRASVAVSRPGRASVSAGRVRLPFRFPRAPGGGAQPRLPIRAAFYYPWFPEAWRQRGLDPFTHFNPIAGFYSEDAAAQLRRHVHELRYARVEAGIVSWWGRGTRSDRRMPELLHAASGTPFRWAVYHEGEGHGDPSPAAIRKDLHYIRDRYASDPSYLRVQRRFVVFVWADAGDGPAMAARWRRANDVGAYVVLKVFPGYRSAADQPDAWHQYAPAQATDSQRGQSFSVSPGFWHAAEANPRLPRSVKRFAAGVRAMVASKAPWQLVTTFNEWGEGTAVEPATQWRSASGYGAYLDALHRDGR